MNAHSFAMAIFLSLTLAAPSLGAQCAAPEPDSVSAADAERLAGLETARLRGLSAALGSADPAGREIVAGLYANGLAPAGEITPGAYACRVVKLGGLTTLIAYQFFDCTIAPGGDGFIIEKPTGSQRFSGTLTPSGEGYLYRGGLYYSNEAPAGYRDADSERDQVGCLTRVSADGASYVLELPFPHFESVHDIVVLIPRD